MLQYIVYKREMFADFVRLWVGELSMRLARIQNSFLTIPYNDDRYRRLKLNYKIKLYRRLNNLITPCKCTQSIQKA